MALRARLYPLLNRPHHPLPLLFDLVDYVGRTQQTKRENSMTAPRLHLVSASRAIRAALVDAAYLARCHLIQGGAISYGSYRLSPIRSSAVRLVPALR
jgi:hypothetical protein